MVESDAAVCMYVMEYGHFPFSADAVRYVMIWIYWIIEIFLVQISASCFFYYSAFIIPYFGPGFKLIVAAGNLCGGSIFFLDKKFLKFFRLLI